jgi:hypothetical protein
MVARRFGVTFSKEKGDSETLASMLPITGIAPELCDLVREIASSEP